MTFRAGQSGNPDGRPKGSGHRQQLFNALVEPHREALFKKAIDLALRDGNEAMLRLFLEKMLPARPADDTITMEVSGRSGKTEDIILWGSAVLQDVSQGYITPREGAAIMGCIEAQRKNIETVELSQRVSEIERTLNRRKPSTSKREKR